MNNTAEELRAIGVDLWSANHNKLLFGFFFFTNMLICPSLIWIME